MNIVVVSPHRDDAAFSLSLAIRDWLRRGHLVTVLNCFTRSSYAPFADLAHVHANDLTSFVSALRLREDEAWRRQQKTSSLQFNDLRLRDAPLRLKCSLDEICTTPLDPEDRTQHSLQGALAQDPDAAIVAPLALGGHVDHRLARQAVVAKITGRPLAFYEDLPYAAWPEVTDRLKQHVHELEVKLGTTLQSHTVARQISDEAAVTEKRLAALCYDSQIENGTAELIAGFSRRYGGCERLWVTPAWAEIKPALTEDYRMTIA